MKCRLVLALLLALFGKQAPASSECSIALKSYHDLIACAEIRSPEIQHALLEVTTAKSVVEKASQWKNPEISFETLQGQSRSDKHNETEISIGIPIELGGKISARKSVASGGMGIAEAKLYESRAKVRSQFLIRLHRFRQLLHEQEIIDEAIATFSKLVNQYSRRPGLSPEQRMSLSVFQLSKSEYDLKKSEAADEILSLDSYFMLTIGLGADVVAKTLPQSPKSWPSLKSEKSNQLSPQMQILQAELDTSYAELAVAKSEAWPILTTGPSLKFQTESGRSMNQVGFKVQLPLPIFSFNGGAKAVAAAEISASETRKKLGLREQEIKREQLQKLYIQSVKTLSTSLSHQEIEKRHSDTERLFSRGVVPSSLVIEAHRTSLELEKTRHHRELKAIEALLDLYAIDGTALEASL